MEYTVTVTAVDDDVDNADDRRAVSITHHVRSDVRSYQYRGAGDAAVAVTVHDDDTASVTVSPDALTVSETLGSSTATYTVVLDSQPSGAVTVTPASSDADAATARVIRSGRLAPALTFTPADWNVAQTVTVTAQNDYVDNADDKRVATITHGVAGGGYGAVEAPAVRVTVADDDGRGVTVWDGAPSALREGTAATYGVSLQSKPAANVIVAPVSGDPNVLTVSALTFTPDNWAHRQALTVTAVEDAVDVPENPLVRVEHPPSANPVETVPVVEVRVIDNDLRVLPSLAALRLDETGANRESSYLVTLSAAPAAGDEVTVQPVSGDTTVAAVSGTLTFTAADWEQAQTVTVTAQADLVDNADDRRVTAITHRVGGGYADVADAAVQVTVTDDDEAGLTTSLEVDGTVFFQDTLLMLEGGRSAYTVRLDTEPTADVTVTPVSPNTAVATVSEALTFTPENWDAAQTVTVTAPDNEVESPAPYHYVLRIAHRVGGGYPVAAPPTVKVDVYDNEAPLLRSHTGLSMVERPGDTPWGARFTVRPTRAYHLLPGTMLTVTAASSDPSVAVVSPAPLTFNRQNRDVPQEIFVRGVNDDLDNPGDRRTATITLTVGGDYAGAGDLTVPVTVHDDDTGKVVVTPLTLTVREWTEGEPTTAGEAPIRDTYTVVLSSEPTGDVTVTPAGDDARATVSTARPDDTLVFTAADWNVAQTVTVAAVDDDVENQVGLRSVVRHAVSGGGYDAVEAPDVVVWTVDNRVYNGFWNFKLDARSMPERARNGIARGEAEVFLSRFA